MEKYLKTLIKKYQRIIDQNTKLQMETDDFTMKNIYSHESHAYRVVIDDLEALIISRPWDV